MGQPPMRCATDRLILGHTVSAGLEGMMGAETRRQHSELPLQRANAYTTHGRVSVARDTRRSIWQVERKKRSMPNDGIGGSKDATGSLHKSVEARWQIVSASQLRVTKEGATGIRCPCTATDHMLSTGQAEQRLVVSPGVDKGSVKKIARCQLGHVDLALVNTG